jgi:hypothetical protein
MNTEGWVQPHNNPLVLQGRIELRPLGVESIDGFDWEQHWRTDRSWWVRIERFDYLLSIIDSDREAHRVFASDWFQSWYVRHAGAEYPNKSAWEGMASGIRAMVLVRYLKREEARADVDAELTRLLRRAIYEHQVFLARPENFESRSNHGLWNAMGLIETARVFPDDALTTTGLDRLAQLTNDSVSPEGLHREHSPSYHFTYMNWLSECVRYLSSLPDWQTAQLAELQTHVARMQSAAYYLFDHAGAIPKVGDSGGRVDARVKRESSPRDHRRWIYDADAGFAIFKDASGDRARRYIIFNIQNEQKRPELVYHFHNDMGAVYYCDDGEVILGDQGRYSYAVSPRRDYFVSFAAHNVVVPEARLRPRSRVDNRRASTAKGSRLTLADRAWMQEGKKDVRFALAAFDGAVTREVEIPSAGNGFVVHDRIESATGNSGGDFVALWNVGNDVIDVEDLGAAPQADKSVYRWRLATASGRVFALTVTIRGNRIEGKRAVTIVEGERNPWLGWFSPGHEVMEPSPVIRIDMKPASTLTIVTRVERVE